MKRFPSFLLQLPPLVLTILATSWSPRAAPAQTPLYEAEYIGALPGEVDSHASAINARGQIVGLSPTYPSRAFLYTSGVGIVELFGPNGNTWVAANDINDLGIVVGKSWDDGVPAHAVRWAAGIPEDLGSIGATSGAAAVNVGGFIVGNTMIGSDQKAYRYTDVTGMELITPEHFQSGASDVNAVGQVAGSITVYNAWHAYRFTPGVGIEDLGVIDGFVQSTGSAINISGQVAGTVTSATGNISRVYRYTEGVGIVLLGGYGGGVAGMNARGDCVGTGYPTSTGIERAFLYTDDGGMQDLELLVEWPTPDHYRLLYGTDINDAGQIAGVAFNHDQFAWQAMRLNPKSPVGPLAAVSVTPVSVEGGRTCTGWATLTHAAPAGGAVIELSSADSGVASVPASVAIPEGRRHGQFAVSTAPVFATTTVQVTGDYSGAVQTATIEVTEPTATGVGDDPGDAPVMRVTAVAPNPARRWARIEYELARSADVKLVIYDVAGRKVRELVDSRQSPGLHPVIWFGLDESGVEVPSGTYFFRIEAGTHEESGKLVIVR